MDAGRDGENKSQKFVKSIKSKVKLKNMKLTFLGTNGWFSNNGNNTICTLLETKKNYIVFDAGDGINKLDRYIKKDKPIILFLSHLHLDHIIGFHILPKFKFDSGITIICPKGMKKKLEMIVNRPYAMPLSNLKYKVKIEEVAQGKYGNPIQFECKKLFHADLTFGYRLNIENKTIVYLCDTGICLNSKKLSEKADVVIHECSMLPGKSAGKWGHVNPEEVAILAKQSRAKKFFLTHFNVSLTRLSKLKIEKEVKKISPNIVFASDNLNVKI